LREFYLKTKEYILKNSWNILVSFSPDINNWNLEEIINSIQIKNIYQKVKWNKCNFINLKKEIRINEWWDFSPCCEIDDFNEWIWNINENWLLDIICSNKYESFLNKKFPYISEACLNCKTEI
jgi:hypothetical protein